MDVGISPTGSDEHQAVGSAAAQPLSAGANLRLLDDELFFECAVHDDDAAAPQRHARAPLRVEAKLWALYARSAFLDLKDGLKAVLQRLRRC